MKLAVTLLTLLFLPGCTRGSRDMSHECDHIPFTNKGPDGYEHDKRYWYTGTDGRTIGSCKLKTPTDNRNCKIRIGPEYDL